MLIVETIAKFRLAYFSRKMTIKAIAVICVFRAKWFGR